MKKIVIAGGTGFMGDILQRYLKRKYEILVLCRDKNKYTNRPDYIAWDGETMGNWAKGLEGAYALINLSGKSVDCRYNKKNKKLIYDSRLNSTRILGEAIMQCQQPPKVWLNAASATIYRHAEDHPMTEEDGEIGEGFSVDVCKQWEAAFFRFQHPEVRQVAMRTAIVLGKEGGVMRPLTRLVRFGLGGTMGSGRQMFSWIHEKDLASAIDFLLEKESCQGAYNLSSPYPLSNAHFMQLLRREMRHNWGLSTPEWLLKAGALLIQTETELILKSRWVLPDKLLSAGFTFQYAFMNLALEELLTPS